MTVKELVEEAKEGIRTISSAEAYAMFGKGGAVFLDVREPDEFKAGHIPGAVNIPRGLLESRIEEQIPDKNTAIVVYCRSGVRSALASATLVKMGYKGVLNMDGGWKALASVIGSAKTRRSSLRTREGEPNSSRINVAPSRLSMGTIRSNSVTK